jgi:flagellar motor switch protein FliG
MALGAEASARILSKLAREEVEAISRIIARTPAVPADVIDSVLHEYADVARGMASMAQGGEEYAREVLEMALGIPRAQGVLERIRSEPDGTEKSPLKRAPPDVLQAALRGENPQTLALVLAHLDPKVAATMIAGMDAEVSGEVLYRVASMDRVSPEVLQMVESAIARESQLAAAGDGPAVGGPAVVAQLLNQLPVGGDVALLEAVRSRRAELADTIRDLMFVFEDLRRLDDRSMQRLLRDLESRELAVALKAASEELKAHVLKNMSERAGAALKEELEMLGAVKVKDVQAAHANIIAAARGLQDAGEITIERGGDDDVIA